MHGRRNAGAGQLRAQAASSTYNWLAVDEDAAAATHNLGGQRLCLRTDELQPTMVSSGAQPCGAPAAMSVCSRPPGT